MVTRTVPAASPPARTAARGPPLAPDPRSRELDAPDPPPECGRRDSASSVALHGTRGRPVNDERRPDVDPTGWSRWVPLAARGVATSPRPHLVAPTSSPHLPTSPPRPHRSATPRRSSAKGVRIDRGVEGVWRELHCRRARRCRCVHALDTDRRREFTRLRRPPSATGPGRAAPTTRCPATRDPPFPQRLAHELVPATPGDATVAAIPRKAPTPPRLVPRRREWHDAAGIAAGIRRGTSSPSRLAAEFTCSPAPAPTTSAPVRRRRRGRRSDARRPPPRASASSRVAPKAAVPQCRPPRPRRCDRRVPPRLHAGCHSDR
jgi:hypothetical protein